MPFTNFNDARVAIYTILKTAWDANASDTPLYYENVRQDIPTDGSEWARVEVHHNDSDQATLGEVSGRRFRRYGIVNVLIFTKTNEDGLTTNDILTKVAMDAFEGNSTAPDEVYFRRVSFKEIGVDGLYFQTNVIAEFEYDEVK